MYYVHFIIYRFIRILFADAHIVNASEIKSVSSG